MIQKKYGSKKLLTDVLAALVREYGHLEVLHALDSLAFPADARKAEDSREDSTKRRKATPSDLVERSSLNETRKVRAMRLAQRFETKSFLPSIGDVRHFLEMNGFPDEKLIQRSEAFKAVLRVIGSLSDESVERLVHSHAHSGPSELGPLSQAINAAGNAHRHSALEEPRKGENKKAEKKADEGEIPSTPSQQSDNKARNDVSEQTESRLDRNLRDKATEDRQQIEADRQGEP